MDWQEYKIGDFCEVGRGSSPRPIADQTFFIGGEIPWIKIADATVSGRYIYSTKEHVNEHGASFSRYLDVGSLIVAASGVSLGQIKLLGVKGCIHDGWLYLSNYNEEIIDKDFLYYRLLLTSENFHSLSYGAAIQNINSDILKELKLKLPPPAVQRRIARVLGRYDSLIENYGAQIRTLEAAAQNLYREWFVRHRINGGELLIDENTKLPLSWEEKELGEIAADKRRIVKAKDLEADMPYVGLEHLSIKSIIIKDCGVAEDVDSDKLSFEKNDILFGKIRPYLHKVCLSHFAGVCSSDTIVIKPTIENALGFVMLTVFDEKFVEFADKISNGTKMPRAEWSVLKTYKISVPPEEVLKAFEKIVSPMFAKMENLQMQITNLREMRDKLLPRLLSGHLEVQV